jgi:hypothetical protein
MTVLTIDEATRAFLRQAKEQAELRDAEGNLVGVFTPAHAGVPYPTARATEADLAELDRLHSTERSGNSLRDIFQHLKTLTTNPDDLIDLDQHIRELDDCTSPMFRDSRKQKR